MPPSHHRRTIRLNGYDYTLPGAYFVTLCTWRRECLFGEVVKGTVRLTELGHIVMEEWNKSKIIRKEIRLFDKEFVIMPNHIHAIVWIMDTVGAHGVRPDDVRPDGVHPIDDPIGQGAFHAPLQRRPRSLSSFIAGFKASVTSRANSELNMTAIWQRNYYEHIIRNDAEHKRIDFYITNNPANWQADDENPGKSP